MAPKHYQYIITGAGCAGLSLLMRMMQDSFFADKKILVIDQSPKTKNDRTWCFWEKEKGLFESIVYHKWNNIQFLSKDFSTTTSLFPYQYKMIQGIDLYEYVLLKASTFPSIEFKYEKVRAIDTTDYQARVELRSGTCTADYIFNSILFDSDKSNMLTTKKQYHFLQHFKGWVIQTKEPSFNPDVATFMDFRISQEYGTAFMYLMPTSETTALVEYTLFTETLLAKEAYETALKNYINNSLAIADYEILHEEFGIIPMTNQKFSLQKKRVINIGIAGGQVKGSTGYTFQFIQKRTATIIDGLKKGDSHFDNLSFRQRKGSLYDSVLLNVLHHHKMPGDKIFTKIFSNNNIDKILRFLDNDSSIFEDLQIMQSVPTTIFLPAALQELLP